MADASSYDVWSNFFQLAGIPNSVAHDYAVTFSQHRIRIDMLKEITKDILIDMGIKAMGDIIAILRHAKNLCTQDELKSGTSKTVTQTTITPLTNTGQLRHLSERTPITTSRTGSNISSLVGNKIQSRLNLSSGALVAASANNGAPLQSGSSFRETNKRLSTTLSSSMAKRLRPGPPDREAEPANRLNITEKTLTVHYPSSAAIARAAQRISTNNNTQATNHDSSASRGSIKSRLGSTVSETSSRSRSDISQGNNSYNNHHHRNSNPTSYKDNSGARAKSSGSGRSSDRSDGRDSNDKRPTNRPRSTVFSRLGQPAR